MSQMKASKIAQDAMDKGLNCCEAVLKSADEIWNLSLPPDVLAAGKCFAKGLGSGCTCGALIGVTMVSGILSSRFVHPRGTDLISHIYKRFCQEFGSSCCRVLRKKRSLGERVGNKGCKQLTGRTASLMVEVWEEAVCAGENHNSDHSHAQ